MVVVEANEAAIKQVIDMRCKQQAVITIQAFSVRRVTPGLDVARAQVASISDTREPATALD